MRIRCTIFLGCLLWASCQREKRDIEPSPARLAVFGDAARQSDLRPGGPVHPQHVVNNPYNSSGYDISEGQRLYNWYNCSGCHFDGGGGIGPPLIKTTWIYGGEPANIFDTIVKGRPNGMPSWGGRIPEYQIWQIVAYVRSMNGLQPTSATPTRPDTIETNPQNLQNRTTGETK
ncbi:MAG: c-type cytochrome [Acidobacteriaceae bacterium]|nr:c-type cytochrome [Acidobacteriaceae bacterium]MBV9307448.1 c-type cytochrome [Acidobacteriaceae bacterium]MBV9678896.1 c-type cytochrome [Acidobacteriaceae bacterium]